MNDYRASHLSPLHAEQYAHSFSDEATYRGMVWKLEKDLLTRIIREAPWHESVEHLDFACGTGRILSHLSDSTIHRVGVDVSPSMLKYARASIADCEFFAADLTSDNVLRGRKFNLITAFRFFPNAQFELRSQVMPLLADLLTSDGYLVFNNHRNCGSAVRRLRRAIGRGGSEGMSMIEAKTLAREAGLEIIKVYHLCVLPASEERSLLPARLLMPLEKAMSRIGIFRSLAQEHVFVCRKRTTPFTSD